MGLGPGEAGSEIESGLAPGGDGAGVVGGGAGDEGEAVMMMGLMVSVVGGKLGREKGGRGGMV